MTEDKLHNSRIRANRAQALANDDILNEAFKTLKARYIEAMLACQPDDPRAKSFHIAANQVEKVREHLIAIVANGKIADAELRILNEARERKWRFGI